jgi:hypothetical protein
MSRPLKLIVLLALILVGCDGSDPEPTLTDPSVIVDEAVRATRQAESFRLVIERGGAPVYVETTSTTEGIIEFMRAAGFFVLPDRVKVTVKIRLAGIVGEAEFIAAGSEQYLSHATLTGSLWLKYNFLAGFDPGTLLAEGGGLERALSSVQGLELVGVEKLDGAPTYHVRGIGDGADVAAFTLGLVGGYDVEVDAWVSIDEMHVLRIDIVEPYRPLPESEAEPPTWTVELYDYNADLAIEPPAEALEAQVTLPAPTPNPAGPVAP